MLAGFYLFTIQIMVFWDRDAAATIEPLDFPERIKRISKMWEIVVIFGVSIGGLYAGYFTPTEAAAVGAFAALVLGVASRKLGWSEICESLVETLITTAILFFIVLGATFFAYFVIQAQIPIALVEFVKDIEASPLQVMLLIIIFYVIAGTFLEGIGMVLATVPVFFPLITSLGYDPLWFGVLVVILIEVGLIQNPPVGMNLFIIKNQAPDMSLIQIYKGTVPFLAAQFLLIIVLLAFPEIATWLPVFLYD